MRLPEFRDLGGVSRTGRSVRPAQSRTGRAGCRPRLERRVVVRRSGNGPRPAATPAPPGHRPPRPCAPAGRLRTGPGHWLAAVAPDEQERECQKKGSRNRRGNGSEGGSSRALAGRREGGPDALTLGDQGREVVQRESCSGRRSGPRRVAGASRGTRRRTRRRRPPGPGTGTIAPVAAGAVALAAAASVRCGWRRRSPGGRVSCIHGIARMSLTRLPVAERRAALGQQHAGVAGLGHLGDDVLHVPRGHELPLLHVHRPPGRGRRLEQVGLPGEERGDLQEVAPPRRPAPPGATRGRRSSPAGRSPSSPARGSCSPSSSPGPRNDLPEVRLALSNDALKTSGSPSRSASCASASAMPRVRSRDSMTHGPAIHRSGLPAAAPTVGDLDRAHDPPSWLVRRFAGRGSSPRRCACCMSDAGKAVRKRHWRRRTSEGSAPPPVGDNCRESNEDGASVPRSDSVPTHGLPAASRTRSTNSFFLQLR